MIICNVTQVFHTTRDIDSIAGQSIENHNRPCLPLPSGEFSKTESWKAGKLLCRTEWTHETILSAPTGAIFCNQVPLWFARLSFWPAWFWPGTHLLMLMPHLKCKWVGETDQLMLWKFALWPQNSADGKTLSWVQTREKKAMDIGCFTCSFFILHILN